MATLQRTPWLGPRQGILPSDGLSHGKLQGMLFFESNDAQVPKFVSRSATTKARSPSRLIWTTSHRGHPLKDVGVPAPLSSLRKFFGGSVHDDAETLESCVICLDSLSSAPVVVLLNVERGGQASEGCPIASRVCPHYFHNHCAQLMDSSRCPLCRCTFTTLSAPIDKKQLRVDKSAQVIAVLQLFVGTRPGDSPSTVPLRTVVELLVGIFPVPEKVIRDAVQDACNFAGEIDERGLAELLRTFNGSLPSYSGLTRVRRFVNWALLKFSGIAGTSVVFGMAGFGFAVGIGCLRSIPTDSFIRYCTFDGGLLSSCVHIAMVLAVGVYHGVQHTNIVLDIWGLSLGVSVGALFGLAAGVRIVDPDSQGEQGFVAAFIAGLRGEHLGEFLRRRQDPEESIDLFKHCEALVRHSL
eukprot:TRINITY_DN15893_c0_g1_i1.p1 TRINITY_DN15893_c0_g1~~TRINITY_DN15893_c0_g1_i1.p1  ORF type:complete len:447 (-),score=30.53 TRINITY_DN15893_c0_g1_i1:188-1420(-)